MVGEQPLAGLMGALGLGGVTLRQGSFGDLEQPVGQHDDAFVGLGEAAGDEASGFGGKIMMLGQQPDFFFGEAAVVEAVA